MVLKKSVEVFILIYTERFLTSSLFLYACTYVRVCVCVCVYLFIVFLFKQTLLEMSM